MSERWDRSVAYTQQWRKNIELPSPGTLAALTATGYIEITGLPPAGTIKGVSASVQTVNQVNPRLKFWFYRTNTAQGATEALSGADYVPINGHLQLSPMSAHKIASASQTQQVTSNEYVWADSVSDEEIPYDITDSNGRLFVVIENFGSEALADGGSFNIFVGPKVEGV